MRALHMHALRYICMRYAYALCIICVCVVMRIMRIVIMRYYAYAYIMRMRYALCAMRALHMHACFTCVHPPWGGRDLSARQIDGTRNETGDGRKVVRP
jgi:hypothetical protein